MASLVLGTIGAAVGGAYFGPAGAQVGWMIGAAVGSYIDRPEIEGPKLEDLKVQVSTYGAPIPVLYGTVRLAGNIIWSTDLDPHEQSDSSKGGPTVTTYTYTVSCAIGLCEGPIAGVRRIWANKRLIYDASSDSGVTSDVSIHQMRVYLGDEVQDADPLIIADKGESPAYRGLAYLVFEDFNLETFGNRIPMWEFEVVQNGTQLLPDPILLSDGGTDATIDPNTGYIWSTEDDGTLVHVYVTDNLSQSLVTEIVVTPDYSIGDMGSGICYVAVTNEVWVVNENGTPNIMIFSAPGLAYTDGLDFGLSWHGAIRYDPLWQRVWVSRTNVGSDAVIIDPATRAIVDTVVQPGGSLNANDKVAFNTYAMAVSGSHLTVYDRTSLTQIADYTPIETSVSSMVAYDANRNRALMVGNATDNLLWVVDDVDDPSGAGTISSHAIATTPEHGILDATSLRKVVWHERNDRYYISANLAGTRFTIYEVNPDTYETEHEYNYYPEGPNGVATLLVVPYATEYLIGTTGSQVWRLPIRKNITAEPVPLSDIVQDQCERGGLLETEIDVTALIDEVDGYLVGSQMSARAAIEPLQRCYYFDGVESDFVAKFVKRGGAIAVSIPQDDRAAQEDQASADALTITRAQEDELPVHVDVEYADFDNDHLIGSQYARRTTRNSKAVQNFTFPIVMTGTKAQEVAEVNLYGAWLSQRYSFSTSRAYAYLEPTDVVSLTTDEATYNVRLISRREGPAIVWEALAEDSHIYTQVGVPGESGYVPQTIRPPSGDATLLLLMDVNLLRDEDNNAGFYSAAAGYSSGWLGATLYKSTDGGFAYNEQFAFTQAATIGSATTVLGDFDGGNIFDELNSVSVYLTHGTLTSATELQVLNSANTAVLGQEIIQFKTATLTATNTYTLTGLLRGRRGTEWAMDDHTLGERFALGSVSTWRRVNTDASEIGLERHYKAPPFGTPLSAAPAHEFTNSAAGLKPYAAVLLGGDRSPSTSDFTLHWTRRTRISGAWLDSVDVALGEDSEEYEVDILDAAGTSVVRTITGLTSESTTYTAAQQTTDFGGSVPNPLLFNVYQMSETVGRGYVANGSLAY